MSKITITLDTHDVYHLYRMLTAAVASDLPMTVHDGEAIRHFTTICNDAAALARANRDAQRGDHFAYPDGLELRCDYGIVGCVLAADEHPHDEHDNLRHSQAPMRNHERTGDPDWTNGRIENVRVLGRQYPTIVPDGEPRS